MPKPKFSDDEKKQHRRKQNNAAACRSREKRTNRLKEGEKVYTAINNIVSLLHNTYSSIRNEAPHLATMSDYEKFEKGIDNYPFEIKPFQENISLFVSRLNSLLTSIAQADLLDLTKCLKEVSTLKSKELPIDDLIPSSSSTTDIVDKQAKKRESNRKAAAKSRKNKNLTAVAYATNIEAFLPLQLKLSEIVANYITPVTDKEIYI